MKRRRYEILQADGIEKFSALLRELGEAGWSIEHFQVMDRQLGDTFYAVIYRELE